MNWMDLLRMSSSNLKRRKLRTFLTVLGVIIGTASIVVMISLGLGMQQSIYDDIEKSGGLTSIQVTGAEMGSTMYYSSDDSSESSDKYITDQVVKELGELDHVALASPAYNMSVMLLKGSYEGYAELVGLKPESLKIKNLDLSSGALPKTNSSQLELLYGNTIITNFTEKGSDSGYWDTGELADIDLAKDSLFLILDTDGYYSSKDQQFGSSTASSGTSGTDGTGDADKSYAVQKHVVRASGVIAGGPDDYSSDSYYVYCDLDTLKQVLKKEFAGRVIPGQPQTKAGKPYKEFCYSYAQVKVDDIENVDAVSSAIREMGFQVQTNAEYLDSMKSQMAIIQAVLGGIGAVSLLVAAIGIANTMMMSIYERTKEIGIIKVLGCSLRNIRQMFLMEAAYIGLIGGIVGNVLSILMSAGINFVVKNAQSMGVSTNISYIPWWLMLVSIGFAMVVGVVAGYFPANRAMRLSPLAAIRGE